MACGCKGEKSLQSAKRVATALFKDDGRHRKVYKKLFEDAYEITYMQADEIPVWTTQDLQVD
jgi:hypothetical protein